MTGLLAKGPPQSGQALVSGHRPVIRLAGVIAHSALRKQFFCSNTISISFDYLRR